MGRSESKQAYQDSSAMAKQNQANAQTALANQNSAIQNLGRGISDFRRWNQREFRPGGEFIRDQDVLATSANAGGQNATEDYYRNLANRVNLTTPQMTAAAEEASRQGRRDVSQILRNADLQRIAALGHGEETALSAESAIPGFYGQQYSSSLGGATSQMGNATSAARTPGFWDTFLPALAGGAGAAAGGYFEGKGGG